MGFGTASRFASDDVATILPGINSLAGKVFDDDGAGGGTRANGTPDGTEAGVSGIAVDLYYDKNGDGARDDGDIVMGSTTTDASGDYAFASLPDGAYVVEVDKAAVLTDGSHAGYGMTTGGEAVAVDLDAAGASGTAVDVADGHFGFAPALAVTQSASGDPATEGRLVTYTIDVENLLAGEQAGGGGGGGGACNEYTFWLDATSNSGYTNPDNATALDGVYADGAARTDQIEGNAFTPPSSTGNITKVELVAQMYYTGPLTNDVIELSTKFDGSFVPTTVPYADIAPLNGLANAGLIASDVTSHQASWTWATFTNTASLDLIRLVGKGQNGGDGALPFVDAFGFRVTTDEPASGCGGGGGAATAFDPLTGLASVPLTDAYAAGELEFVSASLEPTSVAGGVVSWASIGQLSAGEARTITVTYRVLEPAGNVAGTTTTTAAVAGATFGSGDAANDDSAGATIAVEPAGTAQGYVYSDLDGDGWQGATGYETGVDAFAAGASVNVYSCANVANNGSCSSGEVLEQTVTTDASGSYTVLGLAANLHYRIAVDPASLPGTPTQTGDPDDGPNGAGNGNTCGSGGANAACNDGWDNDGAWFEVGVDAWGGESWDLTDLSIGYQLNPAIRGTLTLDYDGDGLADAGDGPLAGATVELRHAGCTPGTDCPTAVTDATGAYSFADLTAGTTYTLVATAFPAGSTYVNTAQSDGTPDNSITVTAAAGEVLAGYTSAYQPTGTGSVAGELFYDHREDGTRASTDEPLAAVTVRLYADADGDGVYDADTDALAATTATDALGAYAFAGLGGGAYVVVVDRADVDFPAGALQTGDPDEAGTCSTCDGQGGATVTGGAAVAADFGSKPTGSATIASTVFGDKDGDTVRDAGVDDGLAAVSVYLYADYDGDGAYEPVDTTTTDATGAYAFANLADGAFRVVVDAADADLPADAAGNRFSPTGATSVAVAVAAGAPSAQPGFGFAQLAVIGDAVFFDANADGAYGETEAGVAGVTVYLCSGTSLPCGSGDALATAVTADGSGALPKGAYRFTGLAPGTYTVGLETATGPLAGTAQTADPDSDRLACDDPDRAALGYPACDAAHVVTVAYGTTITAADFGFEPAGVIGDRVWLDADADGVQDAGEPGIHDVAVTLAVAASGTAVTIDGVTYTPGQTIATSYTDTEGAFSFSALPDGTYAVSAVTPTDRTPSHDPDGGAPDGAFEVTVASGATSVVGGCSDCALEADLGYALLGSSTIAGTLCLDDGTENGSCGDPGDSPLAGTAVYLYDATGKLLGETATDAGGGYAFAGLPDDDYTVSVATTATPLDQAAPTTAGVSVSPSGATAYRAVTLSGSATADVAFAYENAFDLGDLPATYDVVTIEEGGASHVQPATPTLFLGSLVGTAQTPTQNAEADGDPNDDGVDLASASSWTATAGGGSLTATASAAGWLAGWIDFNKDGDLSDAGEFVVGRAVSAGANAVAFDIPAAADLTGDAYARFRLFAAEPSFAQFAYGGQAEGGEVEDYKLSSAPLPVELIAFQARAARCAADLESRVGAEDGVADYVVEASSDGLTFARAAGVPATGAPRYATRVAVGGGTTYLRLRTVDSDGHEALSPLVAVRTDCDDAGAAPRVFPNPVGVGASLAVEFPSAATRSLHVVDAYGRVVRALTAAQARLTVDLAGLAPGNYALLVEGQPGAQRFAIARQ